MYFIYVFYFKITPLPSFPPTVYLLQPGLTHVVHGKLPGFTPTPAMYRIKTKIKTVQIIRKHPATLPKSTSKKVLLVFPLMSLE